MTFSLSGYRSPVELDERGALRGEEEEAKKQTPTRWCGTVGGARVKRRSSEENSGVTMARKHPRHGPSEPASGEDEVPVAVQHCWLCGRPTGKTIVWHHPVPKSRGGRDVVPMHPICQQTLIANFSNAELQRHSRDVEALLANPNVRKFVDWVAKKDPDFHASTAKKQR